VRTVAPGQVVIRHHDAGHRALFKSKRMCDWVGRITMIPSMHIYSAWLLGHNRVHHGFTVQEERDFVWHPYTPEEYEQLSAFGKLMHKIEWSCFGAGIYYMIEVWWKKMIAFTPPPKWRKDINFDRVFLGSAVLAGIAGLFAFTWFGAGITGFAAIGYTAWLTFKVIVVPWVLFNYLIGGVVYLHHINPEIKWHDHDSWNKFKGQMEGTMIYRVKPRWMEFFLHKIMIHVPHHVDARIPFYKLDEAAEHLKKNFPDVVMDRPLNLWHYTQFTRKCKLYDFDREVWMDYKHRLPQGVERLSTQP